MTQGPSRRWWSEACLQAAILLGFALLAVVWLYPYSLNIARHGHDAIDTLLNVWILAWDHHILASNPLGLFDANIFYPISNSLALSEHLVGGALVAWPFRLFTNNPLLVHNLLLLLSYPLCGLSMFLLVRRLSGSAWAGLIAGFFFAFVPYRITQMGHVQTMSIQWLAFGFLFMHRFVETRRWRDLGGMTFFYLLQCLSGNYHAVFMTFSMGLALLIFIWPGQAWRQGRLWLGLACFGLVSALVLLPFFLPYLELQKTLGFSRSLSESASFSADLFDYLRSPSPGLLFGLGISDYYHAKLILFPGLLALGLALWGLASWRPVENKEHGASGPGRVTPFAYLFLALVCLLLSLGPVLHVAGREVGAGPYTWLFNYFPGFQGLRSPSRLAMFFLFFFAVCLGLGSAAVLRRIKNKGLAAALALLILVLLAWEVRLWPVDAGPKAPNLQNPPPALAWLAKQDKAKAVLHLPLGDTKQDAALVYLSCLDWRPMVNGYSGYFPPGYQALAELLALPPGPALAAQLGRMGLGWVVIHGDHYSGPAAAKQAVKNWLALKGLTAPGPSFGNSQVIRLQKPPAGQAALAPSRLSLLASAQASANTAQAAKAVDGDLFTRWTSGGPQRPGLWLQAELKEPIRAAGFDLYLGDKLRDFPRGLTVSLKGVDGVWSKPTPLAGSLYPLQDILQRPKQARPRFRVMLPEPSMITGLKLIQTGSTKVFYWSINEIGLIASP